MTRSTARRLVAALCVVALLFAWHAGDFDSALVHVHLNAKPCVRNGYGATFCGSEATTYCEGLPQGGLSDPACNDVGGSVNSMLEGANSRLTEIEREQAAP